MPKSFSLGDFFQAAQIARQLGLDIRDEKDRERVRKIQEEDRALAKRREDRLMADYEVDRAAKVAEGQRKSFMDEVRTRAATALYSDPQFFESRTTPVRFPRTGIVGRTTAMPGELSGRLRDLTLLNEEDEARRLIENFQKAKEPPKAPGGPFELWQREHPGGTYAEYQAASDRPNERKTEADFYNEAMARFNAQQKIAEKLAADEPVYLDSYQDAPAPDPKRFMGEAARLVTGVDNPPAPVVDKKAAIAAANEIQAQDFAGSIANLLNLPKTADATPAMQEMARKYSIATNEKERMLAIAPILYDDAKSTFDIDPGKAKKFFTK